MSGSGPANESLTSMAESTETWRGPIVQVVADTGTGLGPEAGHNGGGALNGRRLSLASGAATLGVELRDTLGAATPGNLAVVGASLTPLAPPGLPAFGAGLLLAPDATFVAAAGLWQGPLLPTVFDATPEGAFDATPEGAFAATPEGAFAGAQVPVPPASAGVDLYPQGIVIDPATWTGRTTNRVRTQPR
ncbi:MAG: hypothetical protein AAF682_25540 [Planctomycetota bacterium]